MERQAGGALGSRADPLRTPVPATDAPVVAGGGESGAGVSVKRARLPVLTSIRFFAAFWVALYHYKKEIEALLPPSWRPIAVPLLELGACGVSLFFILSGFILTYTYWDRDVATRKGRVEFFAHRFARIYPMYVVSILMVLPILVLLPNVAQVEYVREHPWLVAFTHLTLTHNWAIDPIQAFNSPTWSVGCEVGFYVLFPWLFARLARLSARGAAIGIVLAFAVSAVLPFLYAWQFFPRTADALGLPYDRAIDRHVNLAIAMWSLFRLGEFAVGILIGVLVLRVVRWSATAKWGLAAIAAGGLGLFGWAAFLPALPYALVIHQVAPVPLFAALILLAVVAGGASPRWLAAPWLVLLGEASYSFYLIHIPIKHGFRIVATPLGVDLTGPFGIGVSLLVTLGASILALKFVENPARRLIVARLGSRRAPSVAPTVPKI